MGFIIAMGMMLAALWVYMANIHNEMYDALEDYLLCSYPPFIEAMRSLIDGIDSGKISLSQFVDAEEVFEKFES